MDDDKPKAKFFRVGTSIVQSGVVKDMTAVDLKVYMVLALHANWRTGRCWPSYRTIRDLTGCSFDSIADGIRRLVGLGAISAQRDRGKRGRRNFYTVYRTLRPSPGICSKCTEHPSVKQNRDAKGRYRSERTDEVCSERTEDLCSDGTEQNEIYLNESKGTRSKESPPPPPSGGNGRSSETSARPSYIISDQTVKELVKVKGREEVLDLLKKGGYPVPSFLLAGREA